MERRLKPEFKAVYLTQGTVLAYLRDNPRAFKDKKFHELLVGWILAQFLGEEERKTMYIGFPL